MASAFNPLMPLASFGIYCAILILINYALIILMMPPIVIWHENYLANKSFACCCKKKGDVKDEPKEDCDGSNKESNEGGSLELKTPNGASNDMSNDKEILSPNTPMDESVLSPNSL